MSYLTDSGNPFLDAIINTGYPFPSDGTFHRPYRDTPKINVSRYDDLIRVTVDVAGVENPDENIKVEIDGNTLTISGERATRDDASDNYHRTEISTGPFHRVLSIPSTVDAKQTSSEYKNGLLTITLPTKKEAKPRYIEVKTITN